MTNFELSPTPFFKKKYKKLIENQTNLKSKILKTFETLQATPFAISLKTHKVNSKVKSGVFSSSVTGDIRIIWEFNDNQIQVIDLLDIGGHSGSGKVYG